MYEDCMPAEKRTALINGLNEIDMRSAQDFSTSLLSLEPAQKLKLLTGIQEEAKIYNLNTNENESLGPHYFDIIKGLIIYGYVTSEIGMTQARNYMPIPSKFQGCIPYQPGDKPWAT